MKFVGCVLGLVAASAPLAIAQSSTWVVDPSHSEIEFVVRHMSIANVRGHFGNIKGTILLNQADPGKSSVHVTIDVNTLDTGLSQRDSLVKSAEFFDVDQFPTASFESTRVSHEGANLKVQGNLTLHGITRPVELDVEGPSASVAGMDHKPHSGYSATAIINRKDFGVGPSFASTLVSDEIKLTIDLEVVGQ